jgi:hypothetical protein
MDPRGADRHCLRRLISAALVALAVLGGCATEQGPESLRIAPDQYQAAFDAAVDAARADGLVTALRDPRSGVIETEAGRAPSLIEPWRYGGNSSGQLLENTVAYQRRRARFEFTPVGLPDSPEPAVLRGPDLVGQNEYLTDLTRTGRELELQVRVVLERRSIPGIRRSTWTRQVTSQTTIEPTRDMSPESTRPHWTVVARDGDAERRLLAAVQARLGPLQADAGR